MLRFTSLYILSSTGKTILLILEMAVGQEVESDNKKNKLKSRLVSFINFMQY